MPNNIEQKLGNVPLNNILNKNALLNNRGNSLANQSSINGSAPDKGVNSGTTGSGSAVSGASDKGQLGKKTTGLIGRSPLQIKTSGVASNRVRDYSGLGASPRGTLGSSGNSSGSSGSSGSNTVGDGKNGAKSNKNSSGSKNNGSSSSSNNKSKSDSGFFSNLKNKLSGLKDSVTELDPSNSNNGDITKVKSFNELLKNKTFRQIMTIICVAIVTFLIMYFLRKFLLNELYSAKYYPYLIEGTKSGKSSLVISQNPADDGAVPLYRSTDRDGAEFTYSFWMLIESMEYNYGKWKHVLHKGNKTSFPNRAPGVWILPQSNDLRIYMNTYNDPLEYTDIENVPVNKWFHVSIVLNHKFLDIYFNGKIKSRKELTHLPRQNFGEFWSGLYGGFEGYLSKVRYFNKALDYKQIEDIVRQGPSKDACGDTGDYPPYLDDDWWFDM